MLRSQLLVLILFTLLFCGCANIAKGLIAPNQCKKCEVYDTRSGEIYETYEGCGSENVRLEESAQIGAFEKMKWTGNCNIDVRCETWRQEPEE